MAKYFNGTSATGNTDMLQRGLNKYLAFLVTAVARDPKELLNGRTFIVKCLADNRIQTQLLSIQLQYKCYKNEFSPADHISNLQPSSFAEPKPYVGSDSSSRLIGVFL